MGNATMPPDESDPVPSTAPFVLLILVILNVCVLFAEVVVYNLPTWEDRAAFGEMFGGLGTLFSGTAFAGVVYAIILQRRELLMQREEMRRSRQDRDEQNRLITEQLSTMQDSALRAEPGGYLV